MTVEQERIKALYRRDVKKADRDPGLVPGQEAEIQRLRGRMPVLSKTSSDAQMLNWGRALAKAEAEEKADDSHWGEEPWWMTEEKKGYTVKLTPDHVLDQAIARAQRNV